LTVGVVLAASVLVGVAQVHGTSGTASFTRRILAADNGLMMRCWFILSTAVGVSLVFAVFPAHVVGRRRSAPRARKVARWASTISFTVLSVGLPFLLLMVTSRGFLDEDELFFSPLFVLMEAADHVERARAPDHTVVLWFLVGAVAFCIAVPSIVRGIKDVSRIESTRDGGAH
jgi:hypothetical protein